MLRTYSELRASIPVFLEPISQTEWILEQLMLAKIILNETDSDTSSLDLVISIYRECLSDMLEQLDCDEWD